MARGSVGVLTLFACALAYTAFHLARPHLQAGVVWGSTPSFLLPIAMAATLDLTPRVRFHSKMMRAIAVLMATVIAAVWFEGIVPLYVASSVADWADVWAMLLGGLIATILPSDYSALSAEPKQ